MEDGAIGGDFDGGGGLADFELDIDGGELIRGDREDGALGGAEAGGLHVDRVRAGIDCVEAIDAGAVCGGVARDAGLRVAEERGGVHDRGAGGICDDSGDGASAGLGYGRNS